MMNGQAGFQGRGREVAASGQWFGATGSLCKPAFALLGFVFVVIVLCFGLMFTRKKDLLKREPLWH